MTTCDDAVAVVRAALHLVDYVQCIPVAVGPALNHVRKCYWELDGQCLDSDGLCVASVGSWLVVQQKWSSTVWAGTVAAEPAAAVAAVVGGVAPCHCDSVVSVLRRQSDEVRVSGPSAWSSCTYYCVGLELDVADRTAAVYCVNGGEWTVAVSGRRCTCCESAVVGADRISGDRHSGRNWSTAIGFVVGQKAIVGGQR